MEEEDEKKKESVERPGDSRHKRRKSPAVTGLQAGPRGASKREEASGAPAGDEGLGGDDFSEGTQSLDLSGLFTNYVGTSGSFHAEGIGATVLGKLLQALPTPTFLIDRSARVTFASQACRRIDKHYCTILGKPFRSLFSDRATAEKAEAVLESVFSTRKPRHLKSWLHVNEGRIWGRVTLRSVRIGRNRFLLAVVEDLTAEKRQLLLEQKYNEQLREEMAGRSLAEQRQRQSEQRFELAMKGADLTWWDWAVQSGSLSCDTSFAEKLGYSADEIAPQESSWEQLAHHDDMPRFAAALKAHFNNLTPHFEVEHRVRCKSGEWKWVLTRGRVVERDDQGLPLRASGTNLDITEVKQARKRIDSLSHAMIQAQERERGRIAMDLHDQIAQDLSALRLALHIVRDEVRFGEPKLSDRVAEISEKVRSISKKVRDIVYELAPPSLEDLGLSSTVRQYCREFSAKNRLAVELVSEGVEELPLDFDTEINLFRVIQEALNNIAKHAHAHKVVVRLTGSQSKIILSIKDDGKGFDVKRETATAITEKRMGLWSMEQRIGLLGGEIDVESSPDGGTEIIVEVQLKGDKNGRHEGGPDRR
jgi:PAS domain S-box-containing protein